MAFKKILSLRLTLPLLFLLACDDSTEPVSNPGGTEELQPEQIALLPLGDSRVEGARPAYESYRYELWKLLVAAEHDINFTGNFEDPAVYPSFMEAPFDDEHAGVGGDQTVDVLSRLDDALNSANRPPDIVLLGIGGNDLLEGNRPLEVVVDNIGQIVDQLYAANPEVVVIVEQIAGANPDAEGAAELNSQLQAMIEQIEELAAQQQAAGRTVIAVDMNTGFTSEPGFYADAVHYSEAGAREVAERYFVVVDSLLR